MRCTRSVLLLSLVATAGFDCQPQGVGWRTAQWNVCTTSDDGPRLECRSKVSPGDTSRTAAQQERAAIAAYFLADENMYSFSLQETCEQDTRWIAAYVANGGAPAGGVGGDFTSLQYEAIDTYAPYAFLPYRTHEMMDSNDSGCGPGISTGVAVIARRVAGTTGLRLKGLTNATYTSRAQTGLTHAQLTTPEVCGHYMNYQAEIYGPLDGEDHSPYVDDFRSEGCVSELPDSLRGVACVRTRWQGPGDEVPYRVSTCTTHATHRGQRTWRVRNQQLDESADLLFDFAGGTNQRTILSGDFNVVANRNPTAELTGAEKGHVDILSNSDHALAKVTVGAGDAGSGTIRSTTAASCSREVDAIYVKNWSSFASTSPNPTVCTDLPATDPPASSSPSEWSDHEMMVSPLMSPHP